MKSCIICDIEDSYYVSDFLKESTFDIEEGILNGRSFRDAARYAIEEYGISNNLHNVEQAIIRHCRNCADWSGWHNCFFCNATGEKLMNRFMVEFMLKEGKPIEEIILTEDYFSLFENTKENPTSEEWIKRLEIHKRFCMPRYTKIRKANKERENEGGNGVNREDHKEEGAESVAYL